MFTRVIVLTTVSNLLNVHIFTSARMAEVYQAIYKVSVRSVLMLQPQLIKFYTRIWSVC